MTRRRETPDRRLARYSRQMLFGPIGETGQKSLKYANVVLVGCGALGSVLASTLVRAGVGALRIIDRDFIELDNLQRQILFDEQDVAANLPKAEAAARKLRRVNSAVEVDPIVTDLRAENAEELCRDFDLLLDGTDNLETRYLINDLAVEFDLPWIYGGCVGAEGRVLPIIPHQTPCLRCIWEEPASPGDLPTCDTAGVIGPAVHMVAGLQAVEAIKILTGQLDAVSKQFVMFDAWAGEFRAIDVSTFRHDACPCCGQGRREFLSGERTSTADVLCGRDAVQVLPPAGITVDFGTIADRLRAGGRATYNAFMLRFEAEKCSVTLFPDGRAIVKGTADANRARSIYAKYVGG